MFKEPLSLGKAVFVDFRQATGYTFMGDGDVIFLTGYPSQSLTQPDGQWLG